MAKKETVNRFEALVQKRQADEAHPTVVEVRPRVLNDIAGGGISLGYTYALWGVSGCGKSTILYQMMSSLLVQGYKGVFVDSEAGFSESLAANFGLLGYIKSGDLVVLPISDLNEFLDILKTLDGSGLSFLILDSLTSTEIYFDKDDDGLDGVSLKENIGKKAKQQGTVLDYMIHACRRAKCAGFLVNHARANIVTGFNAKFAPEYRMAGGHSAKHAPSCVINLQPGKVQVDAEGKKTGVILKFQAEKNRFAPPFVVYEELLNFGWGIDPKHSVLSRCFAYGIFQQAMKSDGSGARSGYFKLPDSLGGAVFSQNTLESVLTDDILKSLSTLLDERLREELEATVDTTLPDDAFSETPVIPSTDIPTPQSPK
jgi:RecA/RadA recombinase